MATIKTHFGNDGLEARDARTLASWINCFAPCTSAPVSAGELGAVEVPYALTMLRAGLACPHAREDWGDMRAMVARLESAPVASPAPVAAPMSFSAGLFESMAG